MQEHYHHLAVFMFSAATFNQADHGHITIAPMIGSTHPAPKETEHILILPTRISVSKFARASLPLFMAGMLGVGITAGMTVGAHAQSDMNGASTDEEAQQYANCLKLAQLRPEDGFESAIAWRDMGGGDPARHCVAVALMSLGKYEEAATRLDALAKDSSAEPRVIAGILTQAGQAWMMAENLQFAWRDQSRAIELMPNDPQLWVSRAMVLGLAGEYWESIDDLNKALDLSPDMVDALIYRGTAWRMLESYDLAMTDIENALNQEPQNTQALFERGNLHRINGDNDLARKDWLNVIELSNGTPVAEAAKANIEKMDVHTGSE
ncbi:tetratricopeptide repeat protein [Thalassospira sp. MA62]|nr:tetratricopeptide repeat protein [Thalassospira sp. MA62]